jgi:hypothetical protein
MPDQEVPSSPRSALLVVFQSPSLVILTKNAPNLKPGLPVGPGANCQIRLKFLT